MPAGLGRLRLCPRLLREPRQGRLSADQMRTVIRQASHLATPEALVEHLQAEPGVVLLRSSLFDPMHGRYSFVAARPFLTFRSVGARCEICETRPDQDRSSLTGLTCSVRFGNPWELLDLLLRRFDVPEAARLEAPAGGCFGFWGYDLKNFVEPKLRRCAQVDLPLPDCHVGFYDSLVMFDHLLGQTWIISTGLCADGSRSASRADEQFEFWERQLACAQALGALGPDRMGAPGLPTVESNFTRAAFIEAVHRAKQYIRAGGIYQVNLAQRLAVAWPWSGWALFKRLAVASPAPFGAYLHCGEFELAGASPELFLRIRGNLVQTRPIKGTRPVTGHAAQDAELARELLTSTKERAELIMITDLLRNDLGKICTFGSVRVPELVRLERFAQVQHLVATVEGQLRPELSHVNTLAACFPGGSITGAPKFRAMEIIDELEPVTRGPYTGALGYIGFNKQSQLSIIIRTAICCNQTAYFHVGAGIVADSVPEAEYDETMAKAGGFLKALAPVYTASCRLNAAGAATGADSSRG